MDNGRLLMAEIITDYIRENEWLSEHDKMVLGTLRRDAVSFTSGIVTIEKQASMFVDAAA